MDRTEAVIAAEYRTLNETAGLLQESARSILRISGDRAGEMLHGLVTNDVKRLSVGQGLYAFMLTPKGRPVAELRLLHTEDGFWMDIPESCLDSALAHLRKYLPPIFATFDEMDACRLGIVGPLATQAVEAWAGEAVTLGLSPLGSRPVVVAGTEVLLVGREAIEGPGFDVYLAADRRDELSFELAASVQEVGGGPVGAAAWEIVRVERGIPLFGTDFGEENLAQEAGQDDRAISFEKGCYTGQEVVARIHFRGHVNRILRGFRAVAGATDTSTDAPVVSFEAGQSLFDADRERGVITSAVDSPRFGPIALGLARTEIEPGCCLALEPSRDGVIEIVELPFDRPSYREPDDR